MPASRSGPGASSNVPSGDASTHVALDSPLPTPPKRAIREPGPAIRVSSWSLRHVGTSLTDWRSRCADRVACPPPNLDRVACPPPRASPCAETALTGAADALICAEVARSGEKWGTYRPATRRREPRLTATAGGPSRLSVPHATTATATTGEARQVFTGEYRHTVDDKGRIAVPREVPRPAGRRGSSSRAGSTTASRSTPGPAGTRSPTRSPRCPSPTRRARRFQRFVFAGAVETRARPAGPRPRSRPTCATSAGLDGRGRRRRHARPRRDLGARPVGRLPPGARRPAGARRGLRGPGDLSVATTCASRVRSGSDRSMVEER